MLSRDVVTEKTQGLCIPGICHPSSSTLLSINLFIYLLIYYLLFIHLFTHNLKQVPWPLRHHLSAVKLVEFLRRLGGKCL